MPYALRAMFNTASLSHDSATNSKHCLLAWVYSDSPVNVDKSTPVDESNIDDPVSPQISSKSDVKSTLNNPNDVLDEFVDVVDEDRGLANAFVTTEVGSPRPSVVVLSELELAVVHVAVALIEHDVVRVIEHREVDARELHVRVDQPVVAVRQPLFGILLVIENLLFALVVLEVTFHVEVVRTGSKPQAQCQSGYQR